jgi:hypothetical protein
MNTYLSRIKIVIIARYQNERTKSPYHIISIIKPAVRMLPFANFTANGNSMVTTLSSFAYPVNRTCSFRFNVLSHRSICRKICTNDPTVEPPESDEIRPSNRNHLTSERTPPPHLRSIAGGIVPD